MTEGERQTEGRDKEREREGEILQRWRDSRRERWLDRQTRRREIKCKRERERERERERGERDTAEMER